MWWNTMTRSPGANLVTFSPTAATVPEVSCPKIRGAECEPVAIFLRSVPQIPQVWTWIRISPGPICGTGTVYTRTSFTPRYTAASMVEGIGRKDCFEVSCSAIAMCNSNLIRGGTGALARATYDYCIG